MIINTLTILKLHAASGHEVTVTFTSYNVKTMNADNSSLFFCFVEYTNLEGFFIIFLPFDFCRFCVVIRHNGQLPPTSKDVLSQILTITFIFLS